MTTIPGLPAASSLSLDDLTAVDQSVAASISSNGRKTRSTTLAQLQSLFSGAPVLSAQTFGAKGDGVKDDTAAIQKAIDALDNSYTGTILLPGGHVISSTLVVRNLSIRFTGLGWGNSSSPTKGSYLKWNGPAGVPMLSFFNCGGSSVKSLRFIGNSSNPPSEAIKFTQDATAGFGGNPWTATGSVDTLSRCNIDDVWIGAFGGLDPLSDAPVVNFFTNGITFAGTVNGDNCTIRNSVFLQCAKGLNVANPQAGLATLYNVGFNFCGVGIYTVAKVIGYTINFEGSVICDGQLDTGGFINIYGYASEAAPQGFVWVGGDATLMLKDAVFQVTTSLAASRKVIDASSGAGARGASIDLDEFVFSYATNLTPLISAFNQNGGTSNVSLRITGGNIGPSNIDVGSLVGNNDGRTIIYEPSPLGVTPQMPRQTVNLDENIVANRSFRSWWNSAPGQVEIFGGGLNVRKLQAPIFPTATASLGSGATTYTYQVVAKTYDGATIASVTATCTNGVLGVSRHNTVSWTQCLGAYAYDIYGRIGGAVGFLATVTWDSLYQFGFFNPFAWVDDGSATPGAAAPTLNTTGSAVIEGPVQLPGLIKVGTPNNANAATAGVPLYGLYAGTADPAIVYVRTV